MVVRELWQLRPSQRQRQRQRGEMKGKKRDYGPSQDLFPDRNQDLERRRGRELGLGFGLGLGLGLAAGVDAHCLGRRQVMEKDPGSVSLRYGMTRTSTTRRKTDPVGGRTCQRRVVRGNRSVSGGVPVGM